MITITGASGKTGLVTALELLERGEKVRVVGRSEEHLKQLVEKGAEPFVGDQKDLPFLTEALRGSDAAYILIPPKMDEDDVRLYYNRMGSVIVEAIKRSGLKKAVFLSSLGAEQEKETGPVLGLHDVEIRLTALKDVDIVFLRPGYFYENTLMSIPLIKQQHINVNPTDGDAPVLMVAAKDIGKKAAELLSKRTWLGHTVVELFGEKISYRDATKSIGLGVGIPELLYIKANDEEAVKGMVSMGLAKGVAESFVDLSHGISKGKVTTVELDPNKPNAPTKFGEFVKEVFVPLFNKAA